MPPLAAILLGLTARSLRVRIRLVMNRTTREHELVFRKGVIEKKSDVLLFFGPMDDRALTKLHTILARQDLRPNLLLVISTPGGSPHVAFKMARLLRLRYPATGAISIMVYDYCKSAGTLLALCADRLVMSDWSELGPLDMQVRKPDEVDEMSSGMAQTFALNLLSQSATECFSDTLTWVRAITDNQITTKMAAEIATKITTGLIGHLYQQLDPMRLGEVDRANRLSTEYGHRIASDNVNPGTVEQLVGAYPDHGFVIDREEASELFDVVDQPEPFEWAACMKAAEVIPQGFRGDEPIVELLSHGMDAKTAAEEASAVETGHVGSGDDGQGEEDPAGEGSSVAADLRDAIQARSPSRTEPFARSGEVKSEPVSRPV